MRALREDLRDCHVEVVVRKYLNVHELIAVGIKNDMLDVRTCFDFWGDVLIRGVEATKPVVDHVRARPANQAMYRRQSTRHRPAHSGLNTPD